MVEEDGVKCEKEMNTKSFSSSKENSADKIQ